MKSILKLSKNAAKRVNIIMDEAGFDIDGLVIGVDKSGCGGYSYKIEYAKNLDSSKYEIIESQGVKIYIDPKAIMFLIGSEMDYATDKLSSRFVFNNPNEKSTCGCGESFNI